MILKSTTPSDFKNINKPRNTGKRGGGVAALFRNNIKCTEIKDQNEYESFEHLLVKFCHENSQITVCNVYRIPPSKENKLSKNRFIAEFSSLLEKIALFKEKVIILGDFNIHWNETSNHETKQFVQ